MANRLTQIATRTGDDGTTGLGDGTRVEKDSARVEAYGTVDECNSAVGMVLAVTLPKIYEANTLILVQPQRVPEKMVASVVDSDIENRISTLSQQIMSRSNLERVIVMARGQVLLDGAAREVHINNWFAGGFQLFEQIFLNFRKVDIGAVAMGKTIGFNFHLFSFKVR